MNLIEMGFTKSRTLLIPLRKEDFGLSEEKIRFRGKIFDPKKELHITVVGRKLGQALEKAIEANPGLNITLMHTVEEATWHKQDWTYKKKDEMYHVSKDREEVNPQGEVKVIHAESIILMVEAPGVDKFYKELSGLLGKYLEVPPVHVTLYTHGDTVGIGLSNQASFEEFVVGRVLPDELRGFSA
ncbi:MAG: hypothetical protein WC693_06370 [Patescibacteria group bacterium]|jgi:hypothetical protein